MARRLKKDPCIDTGGNPTRNPFCRHYPFCLSVAALLGRKQLHCRGCVHELDRGSGYFDLDDLAGAITLLLAVKSGLTVGMNIRRSRQKIIGELPSWIAFIGGDRIV